MQYYIANYTDQFWKGMAGDVNIAVRERIFRSIIFSRGACWAMMQRTI